MATGYLGLLVTFCWLEAVRSNQKTEAVKPSQPGLGSVATLVNGIREGLAVQPGSGACAEEAGHT